MTISRFTQRAVGFNRGRTHLVSAFKRKSSRIKTPSGVIRFNGKRATATRTKTRTVTRTKTKHDTAKAGVGGSWSKFQVGMDATPPVMKKLLKQIKDQIYHEDESFQITTTPVGKQSVSGDAFGRLYDTTALDIMRTHAKSTAGNVTTANQGGLSTDVWHLGAQSSLFISNQGSSTCNVTIYDVMTRRTTGNGATHINNWVNGLTNATGGTTNLNLLVGSEPNHSDEFKVYAKIKKVTHLLLCGGGSHVHRINYKCNRKMNGWLCSDLLGDGTTYLAGWTLQTIIVAHGMPHNGATSGNDPSIGQCKLDFVRTVNYHYKVVPSQQQQLQYATSLPASFSGNENAIGEESDIVQAFVTA
nr:MAG: capsid protein [Cressdnaviricota sp.]